MAKATTLLVSDIDDIRDGLDRGIYSNETAVCKGIVDRLLRSLGWTINDTTVVYPEYPIKGRRVDYALCYPPLKPIVLIEVKRVGSIVDAEEQLFSYAFHQGAPILILTDGQHWRFFYPFGLGDYNERLVCALNLSDTDTEKNANQLQRYLSYISIKNGEAIKVIEDDYKNLSSQREAARHLPQTWQELVDGADEFLIDLLAEATEHSCGHKPNTEQVLDFLKHLSSVPEPPPKPHQDSSPSDVPSPLPVKRQPSGFVRLVVTMPDGERIECNTISATFVTVIEKLGIEKVKACNIERYHTPIVATSKHPKHRQVESGSYYILTAQSTQSKKRELKKIADALGIELKVEMPPKT